MNAQSVVEAARAWIGTPYHHQAARRGAGCDCLGLVRGVWAEVTGTDPEPVPAYTPDWSEPQGDERLLRALEARMSGAEASDLKPGALLVFRMRHGAVAKHLGILSAPDPGARFIHSVAGHGVVEVALSDPWRRRVAAVFTFPDTDSMEV